MKSQFERITEITDEETFKQASAYLEELIKFATENGYLSNPENNNKHTREISRIGAMIADYESLYVQFKHIKVKSPLIVSIETQMKNKALNQREAAKLLEIKENTFSQILSGKRNVSMKLAKRLYQNLKIDPKTILEFA